jgi:hypothetical protein
MPKDPGMNPNIQGHGNHNILNLFYIGGYAL